MALVTWIWTYFSYYLLNIVRLINIDSLQDRYFWYLFKIVCWAWFSNFLQKVSHRLSRTKETFVSFSVCASFSLYHTYLPKVTSSFPQHHFVYMCVLALIFICSVWTEIFSGNCHLLSFLVTKRGKPLQTQISSGQGINSEKCKILLL